MGKKRRASIIASGIIAGALALAPAHAAELPDHDARLRAGWSPAYAETYVVQHTKPESYHWITAGKRRFSLWSQVYGARGKKTGGYFLMGKSFKPEEPVFLGAGVARKTPFGTVALALNMQGTVVGVSVAATKDIGKLGLSVLQNIAREEAPLIGLKFGHPKRGENIFWGSHCKSCKRTWFGCRAFSRRQNFGFGCLLRP